MLRWLGPADAERLIAFFRTHTPDTILARYGYFFAQMTPERAAKLVGVDQSRDAALGIFEPLAPGAPLIAIGRFCRSGDAASAEVAFVVREDRRGLGLATVLFQALAAIARERGLAELLAQVQHDNPAMLAVFRRAGAEMHCDLGTGCIEVRLALEKKPSAAPR